MESIGVEGLTDIMIMTKDVASMLSILKGRTDGNTTLAIHENWNIRRRRLLCKVVQDHVSMGSSHDCEASLVVLSFS